MKLTIEIDKNNLSASIDEALKIFRDSNLMTFLPNGKIKLIVENEQ